MEKDKTISNDNKEKLNNKIYNNILNNNVILDNDKILVAVSGGSDSMTLLNFLYSMRNKFKNIGINYEIAAIHLNHRIRKESNEETKYVIDYCNSNNIKIFVLEKDILKEAKDNKLGTEECARKARYDFFEKISLENGYNKIALAHNSNDNVETILLNIIRGSGIKGLCGMDYKFGKIIRPLIEITKNENNEYCKMNNLKYYIDKSNFDENYTRNRIRNTLIPDIKEKYNPSFEEGILRLSKIAKADNMFFEEYINKIYSKIVINANDEYILFDFKDMSSMQDGIKSRIMRKIIYELNGDVNSVESIHIKDMIKLLENNITNKQYILGNKFKLSVIKKYTAKIERRGINGK